MRKINDDAITQIDYDYRDISLPVFRIILELFQPWELVAIYNACCRAPEGGGENRPFEQRTMMEKKAEKNVEMFSLWQVVGNLMKLWQKFSKYSRSNIHHWAMSGDDGKQLLLIEGRDNVGKSCSVCSTQLGCRGKLLGMLTDGKLFQRKNLSRIHSLECIKKYEHN